MRKIKFRGVRADNGEYVYGDLEHHKNHVFIDDKRVVPVTVSQLCGFDSCGDEVYENLKT